VPLDGWTTIKAILKDPIHGKKETNSYYDKTTTAIVL
jgi:hypothetical protein